MSSAAKKVHLNVPNTCFILFGSSLLNSVSSFILLLDMVPTPPAYHSYSVNKGRFAVIFLIFIFKVSLFFSFFFGAYISVPTPEPLMPLSPQHIPVVAIGIICTISRLCSEKCHTVFVRALHLSILQQRTDLRAVGISTKEHIVNGGFIFLILTSKVSAAYSFSLLSEYIEMKYLSSS